MLVASSDERVNPLRISNNLQRRITGSSAKREKKKGKWVYINTDKKSYTRNFPRIN